MTLDQICPGDVLVYWHDTGAFGYSPYYVRVIKVGKDKVKIRTEQDREIWRSPHFFSRKAAERDVAELRADGVNV